MSAAIALQRALRRAVYEASGCITWPGYKTGNGYGITQVRDPEPRRVLVHRLAYEVLVGPIPAGLDLDHLCRVRHCLNVLHLEPVSRSTNLLRGDGPRLTRERKAAIATCPAGHPYDEANTYRHGTRRHCRACHRERARARRLEGASA